MKIQIATEIEIDDAIVYNTDTANDRVLVVFNSGKSIFLENRQKMEINSLQRCMDLDLLTVYRS